jgi:amino acid adenylation domain-containing protein
LSDSERKKEMEHVMPSDDLTTKAYSSDGGDLLSWDQRRMWTYAQMNSSGQAEMAVQGFRLFGALDIEALQFAFKSVIKRQEALRTIFPGDDGTPRFCLLSSDEIELNVMSPISSTAMQYALAEEYRTPFSLEHGPLIRCKLYPIDRAPEHLLVISVHLIVADEWSLRIFLGDLSQFYSSYQNSKVQKRETEVRRFSLYAAQENIWLKSDEAKKNLQFWRENLRSLPELHLPFVDVSSLSPTNDAVAIPVDCPPDLADRVRRLAKDVGISPPMLYLGVLAWLVERKCNGMDVVVGTPAAGRLSPETEQIVGCFANLLPVRIHIDSSATLRSHLLGTRKAFLAAYARQRMPYARIVEETRPIRKWGRNPLFEVLFSYHDIDFDDLHLGELQMGGVLSDIKRTSFQAELKIEDCKNSLSVVFFFPEHCTDQIAAQEFARQYVQLLQSALLGPDQLLSDVGNLEFEDASRRVGLPPYRGKETSTDAAKRAAEEYWAQKAKEPVDRPDLPLASSFNQSDVVSSSVANRVFDNAVWQAVKVHAAGADLGMPAVILTAFVRALALWSKNRQFLLALVAPNSTSMDVGGGAGRRAIYVADCREPLSFEEHARKLHSQLMEDMQHSVVDGAAIYEKVRGVPFEELVPIAFVTDARYSTSRPPSQFSRVDHGDSESSWLACTALRDDDRLTIEWKWRSNMYPPGMMEDMLGSFVALLEAITRPEGWSNTDLAPLPPRDVKFIEDFNKTQATQAPQLLHQGFIDRAESDPDHIAIFHSTRQLTFRELRDASSRLAGILRECGSDRERPIAILIPKGWEQIVAVFAILFASAPYLPVDPTMPKNRIEQILTDADVKVVLVTPDTRSLVEVDVRRSIVVNDDFLAGGIPEVPNMADPSDLAYVIYTSGSTGKPKGVMITHAAAANTIVDINQRFHVVTDDRVLALSSLGFDLSVYDIFGLLAAGGAIVIPDSDREREPSHWVELINAHHVTIWNTVPALLQMLVEYVEELGVNPLAAQSLHLFLASGDWVPLGLPDRVKRIFRDASVVSLGGATEASIWSILYPIHAVKPEWKSIPYGRPLTNQSIYILDAHLCHKPMWAPGEICIAGDGLARGYWKDPEKTSARFVYASGLKQRVYRTGDWGRYVPDGQVEFLGRDDLQIKLRGYRIEMGEIEAVLSRCPQVESAVVIVTGGEAEARQLRAFVVPTSAQVFQEQAVRKYLDQHLPSYMVPATIVPLDRLPLTSNGKIDRAALSQRQIKHDVSLPAGDSPFDPFEGEVAELWRDILNVTTVSRDDNFFELGGDSIRATRLLTLLRKRFRAEVRLKDFFDKPTLGSTISILRLASSRNSAAREPKVVPLTSRRGVNTVLDELLADDTQKHPSFPSKEIGSKSESR